MIISDKQKEFIRNCNHRINLKIGASSKLSIVFIKSSQISLLNIFLKWKSIKIIGINKKMNYISIFLLQLYIK